MTGEKHEEGVSLIRQAYDAARASGLSEWQTMTIAVLKNRLLDQTNREFKESDWGADTFKEFVEQFGDVLSIDATSRPPRATLRTYSDSSPAGAVGEGGTRDIGPRKRIRGDLWNAILDYTGRRAYLWENGNLLVVEPDQVVAGAKKLPSLTKAEFKAWRSEFADRVSAESQGAEPFLRSWLEREQPLGALPPEFRIPWVVELKRRVLERLENWFRTNAIPCPPDLVVGDEEPPAQGHPEADEALRGYVQAVVREMTDAELEALQLPVSATFRVRR